MEVGEGGWGVIYFVRHLGLDGGGGRSLLSVFILINQMAQFLRGGGGGTGGL